MLVRRPAFVNGPRTAAARERQAAAGGVPRDMGLEDAPPDQVPLAKTQDVKADLKKPLRRVRPYTAGSLVGVCKGRCGKGWVPVSRFGLTTGLLGSNVSGVVGFSPDYSVGVVKNLLVWAGTVRGGS
jgi:hypothetical protein